MQRVARSIHLPLVAPFLALALSLSAPALAGPRTGAGEISGRALDGTGRVLAGVQVLVARRDHDTDPLEERTDRSGHFRFADLPQAEYLVVATKAGYIAGFARVTQLPATGLVLVLALDGLIDSEELTWVLRLPARDLLRALDQDLPRGRGGPDEAGTAAASLTTSVEQSFGLSMEDTRARTTTASSGPDLDTRIAVAGSTPEGISWRSGAVYRSAGLSEAETGRWRQTEHLEVGGGVDLTVGRTARMAAHTRVLRERLEQDTGAPAAENQALGLDFLADLSPTGETTLLVQARAQEATAPVPETGPEEVRRGALGVSLNQAFELGAGHRLTAALGLREFTASGLAGYVLLDHWAHGPGGASWLAPDGSWWILSLRDETRPRADMSIRYGAELERRQGGSLAWSPGVDVQWSPTARISVAAAVSYRRAEDADEGTPESSAEPVSARLSLSREIGSRTRVEVGVLRENLLSRDPFGADPGAAPPPGIWTDGHAMARELHLAVDRTFGAVQGRLHYRCGDWEGRLAAPDPFAFSAAPLVQGRVRFHGVQAAALVGVTDTEVTLAMDRLGATEDDEYTIIGLRVSQGLAAPFRVAGDWRLLLDYEGVRGARPFQQDRPVDHVGRVSGGVAVRF
jgi:hypothetical protein